METPVLVYDDDCGFCTWWAEFFGEHSEIPTVGFSELDSEMRYMLPDDYEDGFTSRHRRQNLFVRRIDRGSVCPVGYRSSRPPGDRESARAQ